MSKANEDAIPVDLTPEGLESLRVGEPYRSRKNRVFRIRLGERLVVAKVYASDRVKLAELEYEILGRCHRGGIRVPRPIALGDRTIVMEHVEGENLSDMFDNLWRDEGGSTKAHELRELITEGVAGWLAQFHRALGFHKARGDTILRNFVASGDLVYGLDFEEAGDRDSLSDLGEICSNLLSMRPMFTPDRFVLVRELAERYWHHSGADRSEELPEAIAAALEHYSDFRADRDSLRAWAKRIRTDGLPR